MQTDPRGYSGQGANAFRGGEFMFFPPKDLIDDLTIEAIDEKLPPDADEEARRAYDSELPDSPTLWLNPSHKETPPRADVAPLHLFPRITDIKSLEWPDERRWRIQQGLLERSRLFVHVRRRNPLTIEKGLSVPQGIVILGNGEISDRRISNILENSEYPGGRLHGIRAKPPIHTWQPYWNVTGGRPIFYRPHSKTSECDIFDIELTDEEEEEEKEEERKRDDEIQMVADSVRILMDIYLHRSRFASLG